MDNVDHAQSQFTSPTLLQRQTLHRRVLQNHVASAAVSDALVHQSDESSSKVLKTNSPYTLSNAIWILTAIAVLYYTDFAAILVYDTRVNRTWLFWGVMFASIFMAIASFIIGYVYWFKKKSSDEWDTLYPAAIPLATAAAVACSICLTVSLWPVWSILTPVILFTLLMGVIIIITLVP